MGIKDDQAISQEEDQEGDNWLLYKKIDTKWRFTNLTQNFFYIFLSSLL